MSIYKGEYGLSDPTQLSPLQHKMALAHAASIVLSRTSLGFDIHDPDTCPCCDSYGATFRAVVAHNSEVKTNVS